MNGPSLVSLLEQHRVVLCVGCGGVGKTTTSAALALAAALRGKRVLCLTIDPAKRLANALGLERMDTEARTIAPELLDTAAGHPVSGSLTVMMLDTKRTFDDLVARHAPTPQIRDRILANQIYLHLSARLAGTQEYMAMEKLLALEKDPNFDLIVLDTPPTNNALDFLDAPDRLVAALDSPAIRWFVQAFKESGKVRFNLVARGAALALRGISRLVGSGFVEQVAEFITELDQLFGGFRERARAVAAAFRSDEFAYVLVTSPAPDAIREITYFADRLVSLGLRRDALVVNRVHGAPPTEPSVMEVSLALKQLGLELGLGAAERITAAAREEAEWAKQDRQHLTLLDRALRSQNSGSQVPQIHVPALAGDVHDLHTLTAIGRLLCPEQVPSTDHS